LYGRDFVAGKTGGNEMARKRYTIFILPHAQSRFRQIHFSKNFVITIALLVAVGVVAAAVAPHLVFTVREQAEAIEQLKEENRRLVDEKRTFEASLTELGSVVGSIEDRAKRIANAVGVDRVTSDTAAGGIRTGGPARRDSLQAMVQEEIAALRLRSKNLDASLERVDKLIRDREQLLTSTPIGFPVQGFISDGFGWRSDPFTGQREFHNGLDIVAPYGTAVRAPADGVVSVAGRMGGYGRFVQMSHGYGYQTRYGHLSEVLVKTGQTVRRGDVIGRVGSTGRSTGPHLHYEVYKSGNRVNPYRYAMQKPT
jgi:septal ring factor EnvC (AmiA/AmiB activator)